MSYHPPAYDPNEDYSRPYAPQYNENYSGSPMVHNYDNQAYGSSSNTQSDAPAAFTRQDNLESDDKRCRDWGCAIFFILHMVVMIAVGVIFIGKWVDQGKQPGHNSFRISKTFMKMFGGSIVTGILFAVAWLYVLISCAGAVIKLSLIANIALWIAGAVISAYYKVVASAVIFSIMAVFSALYFFCVRKQIPFTEEIVKASVRGLVTYWGVFLVGFLTIVMSCGYSIFWTVSVNAVVGYNANKGGVDHNENNQLSGLTWFCFALSFYWTIQTLSNINHTTAAGAIGTWWYNTSEPSATGGAFKRAATTSFGSIAFGSFLVGFIQTLKYMLRSSANGNRENFAVVCALCLLSCIESIARRINHWAYVQIALYGKDFLTAASDSMDLFAAKGFEMMVNADLSGIVVTVGAIIGGLVNACICMLVWYLSVKKKNSHEEIIVIVIFCFITGVISSMSMLTQITSAVSTTYVVWAEDPQSMQACRREEYADIQAARAKYYE